MPRPRPLQGRQRHARPSRSATRCCKAVAERLRACVADGDTVARLGGDEFCHRAAGGRAAGRRHGARRRASSRRSARPSTSTAIRSTIGASIGIAVAPGDGTDPDQLLKNADLALYRAKADGRGTYRFFEPEMDARHAGAPQAASSTCARRSPTASSSSTTSRSSTSSATRSAASRRCCAGTIPSAA